MPTEPTPEESARKVLSVFKQHGRVAGQQLMANALFPDFNTDQWSMANMMDGVLHAQEQGWIEEVPNGEFMLTATCDRREGDSIKGRYD